MNERKKVLISNNYDIIDNYYNDEFYITIYYLSDNKCNIIIKRLDDINWSQDLKIVIMDIDNNISEKISLGSSEENFKILDIYTKTKLFKIIYETQLIPKVIIQTSNYNIDRNIYHYNSIMSLRDLNPDYQYKLFNDEESRKFIKENYEENILDAYDLLIPGSLKADLFRYCYLYTNGGCYFDCKISTKKSLNKIINKDDTIIICSGYNGIICIEKNNTYMNNCIQICVNNILNKAHCDDPYSTTGNKVFLKCFENVKPKLYKTDDKIYVNSDILFKLQYKNYYDNYLDTPKDFRYLWNINNYFYNKDNNILNYKFYYYPYEYDDKFKIIHLKKNIFLIKRIDTSTGWGQFIKLNVIDNDTNIKYYIYIGDSKDNEKVFIIE